VVIKSPPVDRLGSIVGRYARVTPSTVHQRGRERRNSSAASKRRSAGSSPFSFI
jgi:hypothetical protein